MPVNPVIWKRSQDGTDMPYLMFAPHCEACGKPVEWFESEPVGAIYPYSSFFCDECRTFDDAYFQYMRQKLESGAWSWEQADAFRDSLYQDGLSIG